MLYGYTSISDLEITLSTKNNTFVALSKLYIDSGDGFNEEESIENAYHQQNNNFSILFHLDTYKHIKRIRFDLPDVSNEFIIKEVKIDQKPINLDLLFKQKKIKMSDITLSKINHVYHLHTTKNDPYIILIPNLRKLLKGDPNKTIILIILSILLAILLFSKFNLFQATKQKINTFVSPIFIKNFIYTLLIYFVISIFLTKTFVTLLSIFYYKHPLSFANSIFTYVTDLFIALILGSIVFLSFYLLSKLNNKNLLSELVQIIFYIILFLVSLLLLLFSFYYLLSGYIYMEWGAFLEPAHIHAFKHHSGNDEIIAFIFNIKTYIFIGITIALFYLSHRLLPYVYANKKSFFMLSFFMMFLSLFYFKFKSSFQKNPITHSPIVMLTKDKIEKTSQINKTLTQNISIQNFTPIEKQKNIPKKYTPYHGIAKEMNLIIYIMESTRKKSLSLYGYKRKTMPFLKQMSKHALVFHHATVNQPRSMKTMGSLMLGTYPDPRTGGITWKYHTLYKKYHNHLKNNTLFGRLSKHQYKFYFGTMQKDFGGEGFKSFMQDIGGEAITLEDPQTLYKHNRKHREFLDERILTDNFLQWTATQNNKFAAILWTKSAHIPYNSPIHTFKGNTIKDKYDNCLVNIDNALKNLVEGLKKQHKLDNTLILILGDHGEALNEKMDFGHGNYLYEYSIKIPCLIYNKKVLNHVDMYQRFQPKDLSATLFYMLGIDTNMNQSINIFSKTPKDKIYMSNIYQDFKLGLLFDQFKFVYRPEYNISYLFDLNKDPDENLNIINQLSNKEIKRLKHETLQWYKYQIDYLNHHIYNP